MTDQTLRPSQRGDGPADAGDAGYSKLLKARHINMIAIGGAIGTGLFLGAGGRLAQAGPSLAIAYAVCGSFASCCWRCSCRGTATARARARSSPCSPTFDEIGRLTLMALPLIIIALVIGWFRVRKQIDTSVLEKAGA